MDFHGLDLNLLVAFDALLSECHVTRAAQRAGVSQPAMSAALARLRRHFNDPLFIRSAEGLAATARAKEIGQHVSQALSSLSALLAPPADFTPQGQALRFTLGMAEYAQHILLPPLMALLQAQAPDVVLQIHSYDHRDEATALLDNGRVDVAVGIAPTQTEQRIHCQPLLTDSFVTIVSRRVVADERQMSEARFLQLPHILVSPEGHRHGLVDERLRQRGLQRQLSLTLPGMFAVPAIVAASSHVATLLKRAATTSAARDRLLFLPPPIDLPEIALCQIWHRRSEGSQAQQWLRAMIDQAAQQVAAE